MPLACAYEGINVHGDDSAAESQSETVASDAFGDILCCARLGCIENEDVSVGVNIINHCLSAVDCIRLESVGEHRSVIANMLANNCYQVRT